MAGWINLSTPYSPLPHSVLITLICSILFFNYLQEWPAHFSINTLALIGPLTHKYFSGLLLFYLVYMHLKKAERCPIYEGIWRGAEGQKGRPAPFYVYAS